METWMTLVYISCHFSCHWGICNGCSLVKYIGVTIASVKVHFVEYKVQSSCCAASVGILASEQPFLKLHASSLWTDLLWDVTQFQARMPQPPKRYILQFLFEEIAHNSFLLYLSKAHQNWSKFIEGLSKVHQRFPTINKCTNCDIKHYGIFIVMIWSATRMYFHFSFDCFFNYFQVHEINF